MFGNYPSTRQLIDLKYTRQFGLYMMLDTLQPYDMLAQCISSLHQNMFLTLLILDLSKFTSKYNSKKCIVYVVYSLSLFLNQVYQWTIRTHAKYSCGPGRTVGINNGRRNSRAGLVHFNRKFRETACCLQVCWSRWISAVLCCNHTSAKPKFQLAVF